MVFKENVLNWLQEYKAEPMDTSNNFKEEPDDEDDDMPLVSNFFDK